MVLLTWSSGSIWVETTFGRPASALSSPCQAMARAVVLSQRAPPRATALVTSSGTACTTVFVASLNTISSSGTEDHNPSEHSISTSPVCRPICCEMSMRGGVCAPRQLYSLLRSGWPARSAGLALPLSIRYSRCEWSRVRARILPPRSQYRRESPQCTHSAQLCCTRQATMVVRGVSGSWWRAA